MNHPGPDRGPELAVGPAVGPAGGVPAGGVADGPLPAAAGEVTAAVRRAGDRNPLLGIEVRSDFGLPAAILAGAGDAAGAAGAAGVGGVAGAAGLGDAAAVGGGGGAGDAAGVAAAGLVDAVGDWLGIAERRVAGSLVVLGYAARLVGPAVAVLLRDGILLDLRPAQVRYDFVPGQGFRLALAAAAGWHGPHATLAERCAEQLTGHLAGVLAAVRGTAPVAAALLWGNVASGIAGALRSVARERAAPPDACYELGRALLRYGPLAGAGELTLAGADLRFRRRSCCLYYRLDGGGTCGDCPLPPTIAVTRRSAG